MLLDGLTLKEIASTLGLAYQTVKNTIAAARHSVGALTTAQMLAWYAATLKVD